jgi:hypothetical protein
MTKKADSFIVLDEIVLICSSETQIILRESILMFLLVQNLNKLNLIIIRSYWTSVSQPWIFSKGLYFILVVFFQPTL